MAEEAVWVVAAATPGVGDAVTTVTREETQAEVVVVDLVHRHVSVIRETVGRQEEDFEIHTFPEEAQHFDVLEDDEMTEDGNLGLGRFLCGRGPALARGHLALTEAGGLFLDRLALRDVDG